MKVLVETDSILFDLRKVKTQKYSQTNSTLRTQQNPRTVFSFFLFDDENLKRETADRNSIKDYIWA
jgi:hypothetical protein